VTPVSAIVLYVEQKTCFLMAIDSCFRCVDDEKDGSHPLFFIPSMHKKGSTSSSSKSGDSRGNQSNSKRKASSTVDLTMANLDELAASNKQLRDELATYKSQGHSKKAKKAPNDAMFALIRNTVRNHVWRMMKFVINPDQQLIFAMKVLNNSDMPEY